LTEFGREWVMYRITRPNWAARRQRTAPGPGQRKADRRSAQIGTATDAPPTHPPRQIRASAGRADTNTYAVVRPRRMAEPDSARSRGTAGRARV